jgi:membrane protease subunit HflC
MTWKILAVPALLLAVLVPSSLYTVDSTEFVYVTQFGRRVAVLDGADPADAGLHVKWPWPIQSVQRLDRRLQYFDLPGAELLTRDAKGASIDKTLTIDAYVCWRIPGTEEVDRFIRSVGTPERAQQVVGLRIASELGSAIAGLELSDLINTDSATVDGKRKELYRQLLSESLKKSALDEYGIEVVDIRLRRSNHPSAVREAIFERIRSERAKKVADYQSEGARRAADIRSASEREVSEMKAQAEAKAIQLRSKADAEADAIRSAAHRKDQQFYAFLKKLEDYQRILGDNKTTLLLSTHRELFDTLFNPPAPYKPVPPKVSPPGPPPASRPDPAPTPPPPTPSRRYWLWLAGGVAALAAIFIGVRFLRRRRSPPPRLETKQFG